MADCEDKIFFNSFYESESDNTSIVFDVDNFHKTDSYESKYDEKNVYDIVFGYFESEDFLKKYTQMSDNGDYYKLSKVELNEVYRFFKDKFDKIHLVELFSVLVDILDLNQSKFYESLSNTFKDELIEQLRNRGYLRKNYKLF